jgi:Uma2 family endonuclease
MLPDVRMLSPLTADDVARLSLPGKQVELVRGRLIVREPPGTRHGVIAAKLGYLLSAFVHQHARGVVCAQGTGFKIASNPDTVRAPDVAFVAAEQATQIPSRGYAPFAPDLLAEILSPDDRPGEVLAKVGDWLEAGSRLVWLIDPLRAAVHVYRSDGSMTILAEHDMLDGENVLPGFTCPVTDLFA